jgi:pimeloyl-ACP methyl ester carboxylesterase
MLNRRGLLKKVNPLKTVAKSATAAVLCLIVTGCTIIALEAYARVFDRIEGFRHDRIYSYPTWNDIRAEYSRKEVRFASGDNQLQGFIYGDSNNNGLIVISHGLGGTADHYLPLIVYFVDKGWRVFAFNNTGVDGSGGESMRGLAQSVLDLEAALVFVQNSGRFDGLPIMLLGHSMGGYAACAVLNINQNIHAVVSLAGFNSSKEIFDEQGITLLGGLFYILSPQAWAIEKQLFGDTARLTAVDGINKAGIPTLIVQSLNDDVVPATTTSIYAHYNEIRNENARCFVLEGENASNHETVYYSKAAIEYMKRWKAEGNYFSKDRGNELNGELMTEINALFMGAKQGSTP